jgi:DNA-binding SARP family transcriptional activator
MLQIYLFGKFCVQREGHVVAGFEARRVQELFCYLLLNRCHPCSREVLASLFWGDCLTAQSKKNLRQILWKLQSALKTETKPDTKGVVYADADQLQINMNADFWLDVDIFEQTWNKVKRVQGKDLGTTDVQRLRNAIVLHQGGLLEGNYEDWCLRERERLLNICIAMLDKLMEYSEVHREYEAGLAYGTRILSYDRTHESTHRWLMRLYYLLGDRTAALKQYQHCKTILNEDLCAQPDRHTQALYQQILADRLEPLAAAETSAVTANREIAFLSNILGDLKQIQVVQVDLLHQVQHNIQIIEQTLRGDLSSLEETRKRVVSFAESNHI